MLKERLGVGVALGIVLIWAGLHLNGTALWQDEAYALGAINDLGSSLHGTHGTMALYYVLLKGWAVVSTATWWLRLFSVVCAVATLCLLRPLARRVGGPSLVALALPVLALSSMFEWKATEARSYALETLIATACWFVVVRAAESEKGADKRWYLTLALLSAAGVLCHGFFVAQLVPIGLLALLGPRPRRALVGLLPAGAASLLTLLWLLSSGISNVGTTVTGGIGAVVRASLSGLVSSYTGLAVMLCLLGACGAWHGIRAARRAIGTARLVALVPLAWAAIPWAVLVAVWMIEPRFNPRYLAPSLPGIALLLARGAGSLDERLGARPARASLGSNGVGAASAPKVMSLCLVALMLVTLIGNPPFVREDWRAAARLVAQSTRQRDGIVFVPDDVARPPFEAAWREVSHRLAPDAVSPSRPLGRVLRYDDDLPLNRIAGASLGCDRLWVVEFTVDSSVTDRLARQPDFAAAFERTRSWEVPDDIVVTLFVRRAGSRTQVGGSATCG